MGAVHIVPYRQARRGARDPVRLRVKICNLEPEFAQEVRILLDKYDIYNGTGGVKTDEDEILRVDIAEGWKKEKIASRPYQLGLKDMKIPNETFDNIHEDGKLEWMKHPNPFRCPCFVVWRTVGASAQAGQRLLLGTAWSDSGGLVAEAEEWVVTRQGRDTMVRWVSPIGPPEAKQCLPPSGPRWGP
ncbi:hypothetical protein QBC32DRAFT_63156 [Pseudoneurospora amorphoporcata]|uniref:Uncharacterized protein n=1 Tax=Pseudoneurospora amorphoporcata TaxID=241081 RepID=A0AAN6SCM0_9PEZI|nr:hypothetical protein QBC32DRAFT_63156 [Pseudoneurospora amorphoporcata]